MSRRMHRIFLDTVEHAAEKRALKRMEDAGLIANAESTLIFMRLERDPGLKACFKEFAEREMRAIAHELTRGEDS